LPSTWVSGLEITARQKTGIQTCAVHTPSGDEVPERETTDIGGNGREPAEKPFLKPVSLPLEVYPTDVRSQDEKPRGQLVGPSE
jgi:hypothetical protein